MKKVSVLMFLDVEVSNLEYHKVDGNYIPTGMEHGLMGRVPYL